MFFMNDLIPATRQCRGSQAAALGRLPSLLLATIVGLCVLLAQSTALTHIHTESEGREEEGRLTFHHDCGICLKTGSKTDIAGDEFAWLAVAPVRRQWIDPAAESPFPPPLEPRSRSPPSVC